MADSADSTQGRALPNKMMVNAPRPFDALDWIARFREAGGTMVCSVLSGDEA